MSPEDLGPWLRGLRKTAGLTQTDLAQQLEKSQNWVSDVERGAHDLKVGDLQRWVSATGGELRLSGDAPATVHLPPELAQVLASLSEKQQHELARLAAALPFMPPGMWAAWLEFAASMLPLVQRSSNES